MSKHGMGIIYSATNSINGKVYVGKTIRSLSARKYSHEWRAKNGSALFFHRAILKYGKESFVWKVLFTSQIRMLYCWEKFYIRQLKTKVPYGYNLTDGGENPKGYVFTPEAKRRVSEGIAKAWKNPVIRDRYIRASKISAQMPEIKRKRAEATKLALHRPDVRCKHLMALRRANGSSESRRKKSKASLLVWKRKGYREKMVMIQKASQNKSHLKKLRSKLSKKMHANLEFKSRHSQACKEALARSDIRLRYLLGIKKREINNAKKRRDKLRDRT